MAQYEQKKTKFVCSSTAMLKINLARLKFPAPFSFFPFFFLNDFVNDDDTRFSYPTPLPKRPFFNHHCFTVEFIPESFFFAYSRGLFVRPNFEFSTRLKILFVSVCT